MKTLTIVMYLAGLFFLPGAAQAGPCEDAGACTQANGECGADCGGQCLPFDEATCCMSGMCYLDGSWCGGVECNGQCLPPDEAACCMSGCSYVNGTCECGDGQ